MRNLTADYMCSPICPCPLGSDFSKWTEDQLNDNNRTKAAVARQINGTWVYPLYTGPNIYTNTTYNNFWDCYQSVKELTWNDDKYEKVQNITEGMETLIRSMEDEFNCNGICTPGAFYFFRNLEAGPPS